jgi:hypothetical protein
MATKGRVEGVFGSLRRDEQPVGASPDADKLSTFTQLADCGDYGAAS